MKNWKKVVLVLVAVAVSGIMVLKFTDKPQEIVMPKAGEFTVVEIGSNVCIPCKLLIPVFEEMRDDFGNKVTIHKYDKSSQTAKIFNISVIPTIILYDDEANEIERRIISEADVPGVRDWITNVLSDYGCEVE